MAKPLEVASSSESESSESQKSAGIMQYETAFVKNIG